jgi:hypothetical protein
MQEEAAMFCATASAHRPLRRPIPVRVGDRPRRGSMLRAIGGGLLAAAGALFGVSWEELRHDR